VSVAAEIVMPRLSDSMEEGTVLKWLVAEGDEVERGQPIAEIETDKANMTYESDTAGVVLELVASEGDTLPVGEVIARVGEASERVATPKAASPAAANSEPAESPAPAASPAAASAPPAAHDGAGERIKASPVARRMAGELGVELARLEGSGPGGRIVKADVEAAASGIPSSDERGGVAEQAASRSRSERGGAAEQAAPPQPQPTPEPVAGAKGRPQIEELTRIQKTVSRRMAESKATAPDYTLEAEIDMSGCMELRDRLKELSQPAPSLNDMVVKACATALREEPRVNGAYRDGRFELYPRVNVGIAVAANDALVVPTIFDADRKSLGQISRDARQLIDKVHAGHIIPPEVSGGTFTVSNLGMYGIDRFSAIINPPQAALLAVGAVKKRPVVDQRARVVARQTMPATLVCDHRILYGADGARFLARVRELLESPLSLAL
jgi:pyruvate dehydrogenase E2 component (dihydrolipoyllysine-residue acetyltransferase)